MKPKNRYAPYMINNGNFQKLSYEEHVYLIDKGEDWYKDKENKCSKYTVQIQRGML